MKHDDDDDDEDDDDGDCDIVDNNDMRHFHCFHICIFSGIWASSPKTTLQLIEDLTRTMATTLARKIISIILPLQHGPTTSVSALLLIAS